MNTTSAHQPLIEPSEWYDTETAARLLGRNVTCLRTWRSRDTGPPYQQNGSRGHVRYLGKSLLEYLDESTKEPGTV